jgi:prepilin-type N-terminal cleavage/methylation domain-containing protein
MKKGNNNGFTLLELIVVIAILSVLAMITIPTLTNYTDGAKNSVDMSNVSLLNSITLIYRFNESIHEDDVFDGLTTDTARMQSLIDADLLEEIISPLQENYAFKWDLNKQIWLCIDHSYNIVLTTQALSNTVGEIFNAFEDFTAIWMEDESRMPQTNSTNGSLSWSSANYTGTASNNVFIAKFWNTYYAYVDQPGFNASNTSISDFKVFFKRDSSNNITPEVAGVYIQIGGTRTIYFSNGQVVNNVHYGVYVDSTRKELVYH